VSDVVEKTSTHRRSRIPCVVVEKNKSRRTFNKNSCDLLTAITHTEILYSLYKTNKQFNKKTKLWKQRSMSRWCNYSPIVSIENWRKINMNFQENIERTDWNFRRVVEKFEVGIEKVNHDAVDTSSKNLKVSRKRSTRSTSDTTVGHRSACGPRLSLRPIGPTLALSVSWPAPLQLRYATWGAIQVFICLCLWPFQKFGREVCGGPCLCQRPLLKQASYLLWWINSNLYSLIWSVATTEITDICREKVK